ncbi:hypothetical protein [uncultured Tateyamaria sp.]|uniref:hypothetical protein n=1 Tax=uncultured Tateyamaria sp. TaxID=455651 RepID=UPI00262C0AAD|nr:hypothetical protein [uncultured Tateyamaria sp.]
MIARTLVLIAALLTTPVSAQQAGWPDLDQLLFGTMTASGRAEASFWMPNAEDPNVANRAVGVVYEAIPGAAGNTGIAVGLYVRTTQGWQFAGRVEGLFGHSPRDHAFTPTHVELTTDMPGPNDPRCCPTQPTRWRIDLNTRAVERLN